MRLLALSFVLTAGLFAAADDKTDAPEESKKLQGKWVATSLRHGDTEAPKDEIAKGKVTLSIDGDKFVFVTPKETHKGTFTVDASKSPKHMDLVVSNKDEKKVTILCVYEFDGETLRMAGSQKTRPKDFESRLSGSIVVKLKRAKDKK